jgi:dephospho-CoA kinase
MLVVGFCGFPGSGKSTALEAINDLGKVISMGDVIRNEIKARGLTPNDANLGKIATELRQMGGTDIIAEKTIALIKTQKSEIVFVDGIRSIDELQLFRKNWKFPLISIMTNKKLRYKRILERARSDDSTGLELIRARDEREINFGLKELIKAADYHVMNNSNKENLRRKTRELVIRLIGEQS